MTVQTMRIGCDYLCGKAEVPTWKPDYDDLMSKS